MNLTSSFTLFCLMMPFSGAEKRILTEAGVPVAGDISACKINATYNDVYDVCGFNVTESIYTLEGRPPSTITENNQTTSSWEARRDILVWNTDDKEGTIRCFPDVTSTMSETVNADGSINVALVGSGTVTAAPGVATIAEGVTTITAPGKFFQVDGVLQLTIDANDHWTYTKANGDYINLCELLSSTSTSSGGVGVVSAIVTGVSLLASAMLVFV